MPMFPFFFSLYPLQVALDQRFPEGHPAQTHQEKKRAAPRRKYGISPVVKALRIPDPDVPEETPVVDNGMRDSLNEVEAGHGVGTDSANTSLPLAQEYDFVWGSKDGNSFSQ